MCPRDAITEAGLSTARDEFVCISVGEPDLPSYCVADFTGWSLVPIRVLFKDGTHECLKVWDRHALLPHGVFSRL